MSSEVPIEIEGKSTAVDIMRELVEHLQDTLEALKRAIVRNPKSDEYRKALKGTGERLTVANKSWHVKRQEHRTHHKGSNAIAMLTRSESRTTVYDVRRAKAAFSSGCKPHPATAPAGSNRGSHGGDEVAEAFD